MSKNAPRPSADELRKMACHSSDPVIVRTLRQLAQDIEDERNSAQPKDNRPPQVA